MAINLKGRNFLTLKDFTPEEIQYMLDLSADLKAKKKNGVSIKNYTDKNIALIFEKTSTRTRCSFEVAANDMGMGVTYLDPSGSQIGKKESIPDTARVLGRMFDGIEYRGYGQDIVEELAKYAGVPVWNGLTNEYHPTQMLADLLTIKEHLGKIKGVKLVYMGDARYNMGNSLMIACAKMGMHFTACTAKEYFPNQELVEQCQEYANASGGSSDYQYKLVVYNEDTGKWGVVRDYGETSGFTWVSSPGSRRFYVKVKDSTGKEVLSAALISINKKLEAKASYKYVNNNIEFTASGNYGSGNYQYKFIVYNVDTGKWGIVQDYSSKNTCVWNASGASAGNRKFYVDIKDSNGTVARSAAMNISTQTGLNVSLKSSASQVNPGASVKLTANAAGGNGSYQYKFIVYNTATKQWGKVQDYSSSNTCTWVAGAAGTRQFYVDVKDASGKVVRSAVNTINVGNSMSVTATISTKANKVGGKVTISGAATGGAGSYQYKFIVYNKTTKTWGLVQNFNANNKITWTAGSAGDREFYIDVKDADGKVVRSSVMNVKTSN